jgi:hypothetical protein
MPVYFCVVATDPGDVNAILNVANAAAALDPVGREVLRIGEPPCPSEAVIAAAFANTNANPRGAMVLRNDLSVSDLLNVADARNTAIVEDAFSDAAPGGNE